jgi:KaiC/GvpD/RAD55 family RecA-like ATPase/DNA-directed RNA polymerase subunit RPC12/RpoP
LNSKQTEKQLIRLERVPTGFPELDQVLHSGFISPSCICVSGQFQLSQRNFIPQLVLNFLQNGRKGLYVCLDRPAPEVRSHFKRLELNTDAYDEDYKLFFIDFFTYSQNALIETATLKNLEYKPRLLMETISPFLDWIKNGFIIIDTLSTLTLNMDVKEAYEFMRGIKMLGRAFNLIIIGVTHTAVAELEPVESNSDGNLQFKESALFINRFENVNSAMLVITVGKDGRVSIRSPYAPVNQKNEVSLLEVLSKVKTLQIRPILNLSPTNDTGCPVEEIPQKMKVLEEENNVTKTPYCSIVRCSHCDSQSAEAYLQCPECQSRVFDKGGIIEHFKCGNVDFEAAFVRENKLVCQKCNSELKQLGVDYRRVGVGYRCANKHLFSIPKIVFVCAQCHKQFDLNTAKLDTLYSYELTEKGKLEAQISAQSGDSPVSLLLKNPIEVGS